MNILNLVQGSPEWQAHRAQHFNASDAPAMMGCSVYKSRDALMREMHLSLQPDVDAPTQALFDAGHRFEALARPLAEELIGEDLYPVVGCKGKLSASFDGLTMSYAIGFEHKKLNATLRQVVPASADGVIRDATDALPLMYRVQMEQQLLIAGAEKILFMTTAWDADGQLIEERCCWYRPDLALRAQIVAGWEQFEKDLAAYALPAAAKPAAVAKAPAALPALRIEVTGKVTASNLAEFKETALAAIWSVNRDLKTDQDFADAKKSIKWCDDVEVRLEAAKQHALSQTASIDALFKAIDDISAEARRVRLDLGKVVTRRDAEVKEEAVDKVRRALSDHIAALNGELAPLALLPITADFAGAIKGLRSITSMNEALETTLATAKIAADQQARGIRQNVAIFKERAAGFEFLFADLGQVVRKAADDFAALVQSRISAHKEAEAEKVRKAQEAEVERARQAEVAEANRVAAAALQAAAAPAPVVAAPAPVVAAAPVRVAPAPAPAPRADEPATLKLGTVCERLGFTMTALFVTETLGIAPARSEGSAKLYRESDFGRICVALQQHIADVSEAVAA